MIGTALLASIFSCTTEETTSIDSTQIWTGYSVFYDKTENKTYVTASFSFKHSLNEPIVLADGSSVLFNNEELPFLGVSTGYQKVFDGFINTGTFTYIDSEGNRFVNEVPVIEEISWPEQALIMQRGTDYTLNWQGTPLNNNENVSATIGRTWFTVLSAEATSVVYKGEELTKLQSGTYEGALYRNCNTPAPQAPSVGGMIYTKYTAETKEIQLVN